MILIRSFVVKIRNDLSMGDAHFLDRYLSPLVLLVLCSMVRSSRPNAFGRTL